MVQMNKSLSDKLEVRGPGPLKCVVDVHFHGSLGNARDAELSLSSNPSFLQPTPCLWDGLLGRALSGLPLFTLSRFRNAVCDSKGSIYREAMF